MSRFTIRATLAVTLLTTACTQEAAQVDLRGQNTYGRSYHGTAAPVVAQNGDIGKPVDLEQMPTQTPVAVQSVSSNDLAPPTASPAKANRFAANAAPAQPVVIAPAEKPAVNKWTSKPHFDDAQVVEEVPVAQVAPVATPAAAPAKSVVIAAKPVAAPVKPVTMAAAAPAAPKQIITASKQPGAVKPVAAASGKAFIWPVNGKKIISGFGPKSAGKVNDGINIAAQNGEPVWASAEGEVVYVGNELQGYGNMVIIKHAGGKNTTYAHLSSSTVEKYDRVKQGDIIGYVGSTGNVKSPQLHFAIRDGKEPLDPQKYLSTKVAGL